MSSPTRQIPTEPELTVLSGPMPLALIRRPWIHLAAVPGRSPSTLPVCLPVDRAA